MSKPPMVFQPLDHTGAGRSKRRPPPRPSKDSLPKHECSTERCGTAPDERVSDMLLCLRIADGPSILFCSWGCLGRFSALQEVRQ